MYLKATLASHSLQFDYNNVKREATQTQTKAGIHTLNLIYLIYLVYLIYRSGTLRIIISIY